MKKDINKHTLAHTELALFLTMALVATIGYVVFSRESNDSVPHTQSTDATPVSQVASSDEIADWTIYRNDTYGFEVKYPSEWASKGYWSENGDFFYVAFGTPGSIDSKPLTTLRVYPNQTTLDTFIKYFDYGMWEDTMLGSVTAKEMIAVGQNSKQFILIASVKDSFGYELSSTIFGDNIDTVRKMSSTFMSLP